MPQIVPQARREDQPWDAGSVGILAHTSQVMDESSDSRQLPDPRVLQASPPQAGQMLRSPSSREPEGGGELGTRPLRAPEKTGPAAFPPFPEAGSQPLAPSQARQKFPLFGSRGGGRGAFLGGDIIRDLQLPRCPARTPARPAPRGPPPLCPPTARPAPARTKLAPGPLRGRGGPRCGLHAVPGLPYARPGTPAEPPGPPGPPSPPGRPLTCLGRGAGARGGKESGAGGRAAAGPGRARGGLRAGLTPCWPRCARARAPARGERAQGRRAASLPPSARAYLSKPRPCAGLDPAARGAHAAGARPGAGAGTGRREPGWISRFHPDSPSALPADSVLLGDHVTRAAFDPGLGAGRGRGPGPEVGGVRRGTRGGAMRPRPGSRSR